MSICPDGEILLALHRGERVDPVIRAHVEGCPLCAQELMKVTMVATDAAKTGPVDGAERESSRERLSVGSRVGRYLVIGELGSGGMGVVYVAHDPELDRKVAIKL